MSLGRGRLLIPLSASAGSSAYARSSSSHGSESRGLACLRCDATAPARRPNGWPSRDAPGSLRWSGELAAEQQNGAPDGWDVDLGGYAERYLNLRMASLRSRVSISETEISASWCPLDAGR
jgi:hypothetical protein